MQQFTWSSQEKLIARTVFERAAIAEEQELLARFKTEAAALRKLDDLAAFQDAIRVAVHAYDQKYDYRYSQLVGVLGHLVREGRVSLHDLRGLGEEKLDSIRRIASL